MYGQTGKQRSVISATSRCSTSRSAAATMHVSRSPELSRCRIGAKSAVSGVAGCPSPSCRNLPVRPQHVELGQLRVSVRDGGGCGHNMSSSDNDYSGKCFMKKWVRIIVGVRQYLAGWACARGSPGAVARWPPTGSPLGTPPRLPD